MQIRYSKAYSGLMIGIGTLLVLVNIVLLGAGGAMAGNMITGPLFFIIGLTTWGRAHMVVEDGVYAVKNPLGMRFRKTPIENLIVEPLPNGKRRLFRIKKNGKRQRLFTGPRWMYDTDDTAAFFDTISSATVFD